MPSSSSSTLGVVSQEKLVQAAKANLNEDPKRVKADVKHIQEWVKKQPHLYKNIKTDDDVILHFLRGCKFSLERTKEKIDMFYTCKAACPEWFDNVDPKDPIMLDLLERGIAVPLKGYDKHGRKVLLMVMNTDPTKHDFNTQLKFTFMVSEFALMQKPDQESKILDHLPARGRKENDNGSESFNRVENPENNSESGSIMGMVAVTDMGPLTFAHSKQFAPTIGKKAMTLMQDGFPERPQGLYYLNMPGIFESIFKMISGFLKDKMRQRIDILAKGDYSKLHEAVGKEVLPKEYGGTNGKLKEHIDALREDLLAHRKSILEYPKYKANEKKRPGKAKTHSDLFGMEGAFRQLEFD